MDLFSDDFDDKHSFFGEDMNVLEDTYLWRTGDRNMSLDSIISEKKNYKNRGRNTIDLGVLEEGLLGENEIKINFFEFNNEKRQKENIIKKKKKQKREENDSIAISENFSEKKETTSILNKKKPLSQKVEEKFACSYCNLVFSRNHDLIRHRKIHAGVKPFKCGRCGKAFGRKDSASRHSRSNTCLKIIGGTTDYSYFES